MENGIAKAAKSKFQLIEKAEILKFLEN